MRIETVRLQTSFYALYLCIRRTEATIIESMNKVSPRFLFEFITKRFTCGNVEINNFKGDLHYKEYH